MIPATEHLKTLREWAGYYIQRGWRVVPLTKGTKVPSASKWLQLVFKADDFPPDSNIGLLSSGSLTVIDPDAQEAVAACKAFFPPTGAIYGRPSKPSSKRLYHTGIEKSIVFKDLGTTPEKATLIEIRRHHQDMAPPSVHPDGEVLEWEGDIGEPATVPDDDIIHAARLTATTALVARYYNPPGDRHDWGLALAGTLFRVGLEEDDASRIVIEAARIVGDTETKDRINSVRSTYSRGDDDPMRSAKALIDAMPDVRGKDFLASLHGIWGASSSTFLTDEKTNKVLARGPGGIENIKRAMKKLDVVLSYDVFSQSPVMQYSGYKGPLQDQQVNRLWFQIGDRFRFMPDIQFFTSVLQDVAWCNQFHPVRDYFKTLEWDGQQRVNTWLFDHAEAADNDYVRAVGALVLIAAVRRIMHPGCKFDELMVLESEQGQMKSSALRTLCPNEDWFSDDLPLNVDAKQIIERTRGKWIIEAAELSGMRAAQGEHLKSMTSRQVDGPVRMAYARLPIEQPRQFIVIGTTNSHQYLTDMTGNRRFWPVRVKKFNILGLRANRDQLWAEAVTRESRGESIRLQADLYGHAALQQERRRFEDPWEETVNLHYAAGHKWRLTMDEIFSTLGIPVERRDERNAKRVSQVMQRLGFRKSQVRNDEKQLTRGWNRDPLEGIVGLNFEE